MKSVDVCTHEALEMELDGTEREVNMAAYGPPFWDHCTLKAAAPHDPPEHM